MALCIASVAGKEYSTCLSYCSNAFRDSVRQEVQLVTLGAKVSGIEHLLYVETRVT